MAQSSLSHTPIFELPGHGPTCNEDVRGLIEECHEGLCKVSITRQVRRGKYESIATITCQENAQSRKSRPTSSTDEIADYIMLCIQYEMDKSDDPGVYKITLYGVPGKGRFERSKHIDLRDGDGDPKSINILSEGEVIEQQTLYISELHQQIIACIETVQGVVKPLMNENKEMMRIVSDSQKRLAEVEQIRLTHDLNLRIHDDESKAELAAEENKMARWRELLGVVKDTGAAEALLKAVAKKIESGNIFGKKTAIADKSSTQKTKESNEKNNEEKHKVSKENAEAESSDGTKIVVSEDVLKSAEESPYVMAAETLKMTIDEHRQWKKIYAAINEEQSSILDSIFIAKSDEEVGSLVKKLKSAKDPLRLLKLKPIMNEQQNRLVDFIYKSDSNDE